MALDSGGVAVCLSDLPPRVKRMAAKPNEKCFVCEVNPPQEGDFMCTSCKEEHPMCYQCGRRKRNFPFKFCGKCYQKSRNVQQAAALFDDDKSEDEGDLSLDGACAAGSIINQLMLFHISESEFRIYRFKFTPWFYFPSFPGLLGVHSSLAGLLTS